ncbi:MAG: hemolysin, partial [Phycisphaerales bacterium]|nr:hemolysin [Phycisphaerales bacterium]
AIAEQRSLVGETSADETQVKAVKAMVAELESRREQLRKLEAERLESRIIEADGSRIAAESTLRQQVEQRDRLKKLGDNSVTPREVSEAETAVEVARAEAGSALAQCTRLKAELAAVRAGLFSGDGSREAADARQRIDELKVRLLDLEAQNTRHIARLDGLRSSISAQNAKLNERSHAKIAAPVDAVVWSVPASTGTHANVSEPLVTLYDPATRFVLATVRESSAYRIQPGDHAVITFLGTGKQVNGRVQSSSGSGSRVDDSQLLARLPDNRDARAHVRIAVDEWPAEVAGTSPFDQIGLEVTVSIDGSSWFKRWLKG